MLANYICHSKRVDTDFVLCSLCFTASASGKNICSPLKILDNTVKKVKLSSKNTENMMAKVKVIYCRSDEKIDGEKIIYTHTVGICILPSVSEKCRIMTQCERIEDEKIERPVGRVTVYYTEPCDSAFSVAKRYHTPIKKLCEDNAISSGVMSGDEPILPKRLIIY